MDEIVEVRFIKDHQSVHSGNSFYRTGTRAHFYNRHAKVLVDRGAAEYTVREKPKPETEPVRITKHSLTPFTFEQEVPLEVEPLSFPEPSVYFNMEKATLHQIAKERGIKGYWNMKRETLIDRLEEADGS